MTTEEKAKAYDEALKWMRELYPGLHGATKKDAEHYFPELRESEDERVMREFNDWLCEEIECLTNDLRDEKDRRTLNILCYVLKKFKDRPEKQKESLHISESCKENADSFTSEQKPAEWSEEDQDKINTILGVLHLIGNYNFDSWLKSIRPQPKQEWNEYDNEMFHCICAGLCHLRKLYEKNEDAVSDYNAMIEWFRNRFKSLSPSWKPSEEQMKGLKFFLDFHRPQRNAGTTNWREYDAVESLYEQLKKL